MRTKEASGEIVGNLFLNRLIQVSNLGLPDHDG